MPDQQPLGPSHLWPARIAMAPWWKSEDGDLLRFRCHTGHAFTLEALALTQSEAWERTLYAAMRAQQEQAMLARYMVETGSSRGHAFQAKVFARRERDYEDGAEMNLTAARREQWPRCSWTRGSVNVLIMA